MKKLKYIAIIFICLFWITPVKAANVYNMPTSMNISDMYLTMTDANELQNVCDQEGILKSFKFLGRILYVIKIVIPILLIVLGTIDFGKVIIAGKDDAIIGAAKRLASRAAAGIIIFLLPTIINFVFGLLPQAENNYSKCSTCLFKPSECEVSSSNNKPSGGAAGGGGNHQTEMVR